MISIITSNVLSGYCPLGLRTNRTHAHTENTHRDTQKARYEPGGKESGPSYLVVTLVHPQCTTLPVTLFFFSWFCPEEIFQAMELSGTIGTGLPPDVRPP